jgi:hypothetical protein
MVLDANFDKKVRLFLYIVIQSFTTSPLHSFTPSPIPSLTHFASFCDICVYSLQTMLFGFINIIKMKKHLLLIFGLLGLVTLMAESGPKKSSLLSVLGLDCDATCCDVTACCQVGDASCCDLSTCCTTTSNCCSAVANCCTMDATDQTNTTKVESNAATQGK